MKIETSKILLIGLVSFATLGLVTSSWGACQRVSTTCYPGSQASPTSALADVQDCVDNYAQSGDTVSIPAGTPTWTTPLTIYNKNITVKGPDCTVDSNGRPTSCPLTITLTGNAACSGHYAGPTAGICVATNSSAAVTDGRSSTGLAVKKVSWRIHDMAFATDNVPSDTQDLIEIETSEYNYNPSVPGNDYPIMGWRVDHIKIDRSTYLSSLRFFIVGGVTWGLMDHLNLTSAGNIILYQVAGLTHEWYDGYFAGTRPGGSWSGNYAWSLPLHLGSDEALYVEDSTFSFTGTGAYGWNDMAYGADIVIRNNIIKNNTALYSHTGEGGTLGRGGGRKYEVYNNLCDGAGHAWSFIGLQEDGTGVVFNNSAQNYQLNNLYPSVYRATTYYDYTGGYYGNCWGTSYPNWGDGATSSHDWIYESNGWPCLDQIGRGLINGCSGANCSLTTPQDSIPLLLWNNGPQCSCSGGTYPVSGSNCTSGPCDNSVGVTVNPAGGTKVGTMDDYIKTTAHTSMGAGHPGYGDKDYCIIPSGTNAFGYPCGNYTNTYVPYTYPHPLQGASDITPPAAPGGLSVN